MSVAVKTPASSSRRWCQTTPAVVAVIAIAASFYYGWRSDRARPNLDYVHHLQAISATDYDAAMQLGRLYALDSINSTSGPALPTQAQTAVGYFQEAARLAPDACEPVLAQAVLQFVMGRDDDAADLLHGVRGVSSCSARADLYLGYIDEFGGALDRAKASFYAARELADGDVHENFYDRVYDHTDPDLEPDQYAARLRKLIAFRDLFEAFRQRRNGSDGREFLRPSSSWFGADVDVAGGFANLETARRTLIDLDFVVLRGFVTPWEVRQIQEFYADLIRDGIVTNYDPELSRTITYNDRVSHWLGQRLTGVLNQIADQSIKHVYSFLCWHRVVEGGGRPVLKPHTDREDNEWTVSIQMHYDDNGGGGAWPIWVHTIRQEQEKAGWQALPPRAESVKIVLRDGDAVLFRGRRHIHWRDPMPTSGREFSSLLLHYVPSDFDWHDFKFARQIADPAI